MVNPRIRANLLIGCLAALAALGGAPVSAADRDAPAASARKRIPAPKLGAVELSAQPNSPLWAIQTRAAPGVVRIDAGTRSGAGFLIGQHGVVVTSWRLVAGADDAQVTFHDGTARPVQGALGYDPRQDLAVLKVDPAGLEFSPLELSEAAPTDSLSVLAMGRGQGLVDAASPGQVAAVRSGEELIKDDAKLADLVSPESQWLLTAGGLSAGHLGGPLLSDADGKVVGVVAWGLPRGDKADRPELAASAVRLREFIVKQAATEPTPLKVLAARLKADPASPRAELPASAAGLPAPKLYQRAEAADAILRARAALKCSRCQGAGTITATVLRPYRHGLFEHKQEVQETQTCPECGGSGAAWTDRACDALAGLVERVMMIDTKACPQDEQALLRKSARDVFQIAAIDGVEEARKSTDVAWPVLSRADSAGAAVVFHGYCVRRLAVGGDTVYAVRVYQHSGIALVSVVEPAGAAEGRHCLVAGLACGERIVAMDDGSVRGPGVCACAIEPVHP